MPRDGELSHQKNNAVILSGGEAGARDLTSADAIDAVDGNAYDVRSVKTLSTTSVAYTVVWSFEWLAHSQDDIPRPSPAARRVRFMEVCESMGAVAPENNHVILSGGEAGARDLTSLDVIDGVDGNTYDACSVKTSSTASLAYTVVRSFEWLAPFSG